MTEQIIYPSIDLFLYDLKDGLGEDETKVDKNCENFCRKIYGDLDEKELQQKVGQFNKFKNFDATNIELLETITRSFASPLDGYYYPLQVNDTYSLLVDYSGKLDANGKSNDQIQNLGDEPFLKLKEDINQRVGQQTGTIGQTWLLWGRLTSPKTDVEIKEIAQKCYTQVVNDYNWQRDLIGHGHLGGGKFFEVWYHPQNLAVESKEFWNQFRQLNQHILIWLFPDDISPDEMREQVKNLHQDFLRLWQYRHKVVWAYYQSRHQKHTLKQEYIQIQPSIQQSNQLTELLQNNNLRLSDLQKTLTENLINLSDYTIALTYLENHSPTIQLNLDNYKLRLAEIEKSYPGSDLEVLKKFSGSEIYAQKYQRQVDADYANLSPGLVLLQNLNSTVQGIIDLEQTKSDRTLNTTIAIAGVGLATSQIASAVILATPPKEEKNLLLFQVEVFTWSVGIGIIFALIIWIIIIIRDRR